MIAFLVYVADLLLGCAMGFVAQPSFWINILSSDERTQEVQAARTAAGSLNDMKNGALLTHQGVISTLHEPTSTENWGREE